MLRQSCTLSMVLVIVVVVNGCPSTPSADAGLDLDGGAVIDDGGAILDDGGARLDDGGAILDDGGAILEDGGPIIDDGGAILDDGGAFIDDGGPIIDDGGPIIEDGGVQFGDGGFNPDDVPTGTLGPNFGELFISLLHLPLGFPSPMGESTVVVGPDGTLVLIDVGNAAHDDDVRAVVEELNTVWLTPARGYPARTARQVEWVILTHFHGDHAGGFSDLLVEANALSVTRGVVHRGLVDLGPASNLGDAEDICAAPATLPIFALCEGATPAACGSLGGTNADVGVTCPGLYAGNIDDESDDGTAPTAFSLGAGARLTFLAASARLATATGVTMVPNVGVDENNEENGRSVVVAIEHGAFRAIFGGDLSGSGDPGEPDVETPLVFDVLTPEYGPRGFDVVHASHHARQTSSNAAFVDATAPNDGRARTVVAGINEGYAGSPQADVLTRFLDDDRLGAGRFFVTHRATGGASHARLVDADGDIRIVTAHDGDGYYVQARSLTAVPAPLTVGHAAVGAAP